MKKIILAVAVVATAAIAGWNYQQSQKTSFLFSDLSFENIDATAAGENGGVSCYCGRLYGKGCKADNSGSSCNPSGSSDCWNYDRNCS